MTPSYSPVTDTSPDPVMSFRLIVSAGALNPNLPNDLSTDTSRKVNDAFQIVVFNAAYAQDRGPRIRWVFDGGKVVHLMLNRCKLMMLSGVGREDDVQCKILGLIRIRVRAYLNKTLLHRPTATMHKALSKILAER